jgi:hypothetical protein
MIKVISIVCEFDASFFYQVINIAGKLTEKSLQLQAFQH